MAVYKNIALREHEDRRYGVSREQGAAYSVATGVKHVEVHTGAWPDILDKADEVAAEPADEWAVTCECQRLGGMLGTLTITRTEYKTAEEEAELGTAENPVYTTSFTVQAEPLLIHPRYVSSVRDADAELLRELQNGAPLMSNVIYGGKAMYLRTALAKLNGMAAEVRDYFMRGVTEYYEVYGEATAKWKGAARSYTVGEICTPPGSPGAITGREWLCVGVGSEKNGKEVWHTATFRLSGPGGWDKKLYGGSSI